MTRPSRYAPDGAERKHVDLYHTWRAALRGLAVLPVVLVLLCVPRPARGVAGRSGAAPLVVIDPGHGGANLGAAGRLVREKHLTLAVALRLRDLLQERGYRVLLTRQDDRYLTLRERVRRSNGVDAAAFISLHANASPDHTQQGIETYVLDRGLAEVEAYRQVRAAGGPVAGLLADLRAAQQLRESVRLGRLLQERLLLRRGGMDRGVRQSDFDVLSGVQAPAVLVEMGFIDHREEGAALAGEAAQAQVAEALAEGLDRFFSR